MNKQLSLVTIEDLFAFYISKQKNRSIIYRSICVITIPTMTIQLS
jgi:hypothetical protein